MKTGALRRSVEVLITVAAQNAEAEMLLQLIVEGSLKESAIEPNEYSQCVFRMLKSPNADAHPVSDCATKEY
jgi:hypothetical protein